MRKLAEARAYTQQILADAMTPAVMCSFGIDSVLTLHLAREVKPDIPAIWLRHGLTREQNEFAESLILQWGLTVLGIGIAGIDYCRTENGWCAQFHYEINGVQFSTVSDVVDAPRCPFCLPHDVSRDVTLPNDALLLGWKDADSHPLMQQAYPPDGAALGAAQLFAPLRDWTDAEVRAVTEALQLPYNRAKYDGNEEAADPDNCLVSIAALEAGRCSCAKGKAYGQYS